MGSSKNIQLEGVLHQIDLTGDEDDDFCRLTALVVDDSGEIFNTYIERTNDSDNYALECKSLNQMYDYLNSRKKCRVRVTVAPDEDADDDLPIFRVVRKYQVLSDSQPRR